MPNPTCDGACCAVFPYTSGLPEIHRRADAGCGQSRKLVDMLIELAPGEAVERANAFGVDFSPYHEDGNAGVAGDTELFTCAWWDEETRLCGNYDERPRMCRDYPYAGRCTATCECDYVAPMNIISDYAANKVRALARREGL